MCIAGLAAAALHGADGVGSKYLQNSLIAVKNQRLGYNRKDGALDLIL